jgi:hypothetical protein
LVIVAFAAVVTEIAVVTIVGDLVAEFIVIGTDTGVIVEISVEDANEMAFELETVIVFGSITEIVDGIEVDTVVKLVVDLFDESVVDKIAELVVKLLVNVIDDELTLTLLGKYVSK